MADAPWHVYLLQCADGTNYCGVTTDVQRRLRQHNGEIPGGARYTASRRPVTMLISVPAASRSDAQRLEWRIKALPRRKKLATLRRWIVDYAQF